MADFIMPTLGADMTEGTLVDWLVEPGEEVRRGDIIAEVETGKGVIEIEVFEDGIFEKMLVQPGETVSVGTVMAVIRTDEEDHRETKKAAQKKGGGKTEEMHPSTHPPKPESERERAPLPPSGIRIKISPLARQKARDLGIDPARIQGTGPQGAVTAKDIEQAAHQHHPSPGKTTWMQGRETAPREGQQVTMRQAIARATALSNREIPHYYLQTRIDMHRALAWLAEKNSRRPIRERILPVILGLKSVALAARKVPELNGFWTSEGHVPSREVHIGFAISLRGGGLVAPAIHEVDTKGPEELMRGMHDLITRARSGRLRGSEMTDATLTVTNMGDRGVETIFGVIYPPQVALVGLGKIQEQPWAENGMLTVRPVLNATLAADHRATDGHTGARFLEAMNQALQTPEKL